MALRFIDFKTSEAQNFEGWFRFAQPFFKLTEFIIRCWTFNVDKLVKSPKFRHACEGRHPELFKNTGFPPSREGRQRTF
jgi:hypothetical protein